MVGALLARMFGTKRLAGSRFLGPTSTTTRGGKLTTLGIDLAVRAAHVATPTDERGEVLWKRRRFFNRTGMENGGHHPREAANVGSRGIRGLTPLRQSLHASSDPTGKHWRPSGVRVGGGTPTVSDWRLLGWPSRTESRGGPEALDACGPGQMSHSGHVLQSAKIYPSTPLMEPPLTTLQASLRPLPPPSAQGGGEGTSTPSMTFSGAASGPPIQASCSDGSTPEPQLNDLLGRDGSLDTTQAGHVPPRQRCQRAS